MCDSKNKTGICALLDSDKPENEKIRLLKDLLENGFDPNEKRISPDIDLVDEKESCLNSAINCNSSKCLEILLDHGSDPDCFEDEIFPIRNIFEIGDKTTFEDKYNMLELLLEKGAEPNRSKKRKIGNLEIYVNVSILSYSIFSFESNRSIVDLMFKYGAKNTDPKCEKNQIGSSTLETWVEQSNHFEKELSISDKLKRPFDHAIVYGDFDFITKRLKTNEDEETNKEILNLYEPSKKVIEILRKLSIPLNFSTLRYSNSKVRKVVFTLMLISYRLSSEGEISLPYPVISNIIKYINRDWYKGIKF